MSFVGIQSTMKGFQQQFQQQSSSLLLSSDSDDEAMKHGGGHFGFGQHFGIFGQHPE